MFYAASEIVFWILLAALIGGGIGYGINEAKSVRLGKRLNASGADAPLERELAVAWDTIEDLNRRLQVAHETIRSSMSEAGGEVAKSAGPAVPLAPPDAVPTPIGAAPSLVPTRPIDEEPGRDGHADPDAITFESNGSEPAADDAPQPETNVDGAADETQPDEAQPDEARPDETQADETQADEAQPDETETVEDDADESEPVATDGVVGARLSERVASASLANRIGETITFD